MINTLQRLLVPVLAVLLVLAILSFMVTYTVRFNEVAVVTTFGKASDSGDVQQPGLKLKLPYPIQSVTKYDSRLRYIETRPETQQTRDNRQVTIQAFASYRVTDPLKFFRSFSARGGRAEDHFEEADQRLSDRLRAALGEVSKYNMDELFTPEFGASKIPDLEERMLAAVRSAGSESVPDQALSLSDFGVEVTTVGIHRVVLPDRTTEAVIQRMSANRDRIAQELIASGSADAVRIRSRAEAHADRINAFADARARAIQAQGRLEAARYLAMQSENPELAVYLRNLDLLKDSFGKRLTLVLDTSDPGLGLFNPSTMSGLGPGAIPVPQGLPPRFPGESADGEVEETASGGE